MHKYAHDIKKNSYVSVKNKQDIKITNMCSETKETFSIMSSINATCSCPDG